MRYLPLFLLAVLAGCVARADHPKALADYDAIDALYERFSAAYADLDPDAVVALYTDDAYYLPGDGPILNGREALKQSFGFLANTKKVGGKLDIAFHSVDRTISDNLAYDVGYYRLTSLLPDGEGRTSVGKFTVILKKQVDGSWRFHVDSFSGAPVEAFPQP